MARVGGLALLAAIICGCQSDPSIIGKWSTTVRQFQMTIDFRPDGKVEGAATLNGKTIEVTGTYRLAGRNLTVNFDHVGSPRSNSDPMTALAIQQFKPITESGWLEWKNPHEFILSNGNRVLIFERPYSR